LDTAEFPIMMIAVSYGADRHRIGRSERRAPQEVEKPEQTLILAAPVLLDNRCKKLRIRLTPANAARVLIFHCRG